jgi:uncharacterized protein (DUF305 family)
MKMPFTPSVNAALLAGTALFIIQAWSGACERCKAWGPFYREMNQSTTQMEAAMTQADGSFTGDPDADFLRMMIPHHQGAIDMAKAVLLHGKDPVVRRLAQEIIVTQDAEITVMRRQLEKQSGSSAASRPSGDDGKTNP